MELTEYEYEIKDTVLLNDDIEKEYEEYINNEYINAMLYYEYCLD